MASLDHAVTSEAEIKSEWDKKIKALGLTYGKIITFKMNDLRVYF